MAVVRVIRAFPGKRARIVWPHLLPEHFVLEMKVVSVFGSNAGKPFQICIGGQKRSVVFATPGVYSFPFDNVKHTDVIEILIPDPASPKSSGLSEDGRALGLGLKRIRIQNG